MTPGTRPQPIVVGATVSYRDGRRVIRGEVETYRVLGAWRWVTVQREDGPREMLIVTPCGRAVEPVALARAVEERHPIHDLPTTLVDQVLAKALLLRCGKLGDAED